MEKRDEERHLLKTVPGDYQTVCVAYTDGPWSVLAFRGVMAEEVGEADTRADGMRREERGEFGYPGTQGEYAGYAGMDGLRMTEASWGNGALGVVDCIEVEPDPPGP